MKSKKMIGMTAFLGVTAFTSVFAASAGTTTAGSSFHKGARRGGMEQRTLTEEEKKAHEALFAENLASALGTTKDQVLADLANNKSPEEIIKASGQDKATVETKLKSAHEAAVKAKVSADVAAGKLTQAEADNIIANLADGKGVHKMGMMGNKGFDKTKLIQDMATILNISVATIESDIAAGKKPIEIVKASGMSETDFETKMKALRMNDLKSKLQAEVAAGTITQADADSKLAQMAAHKEGMRGMRSTFQTIRSALHMSQ